MAPSTDKHIRVDSGVRVLDLPLETTKANQPPQDIVERIEHIDERARRERAVPMRREVRIVKNVLIT